jgi:hypothetical protein
MRKAKPIWVILLLTLWINIAESVRWMLYTQSRFEALFTSLGLVFPNKPINNILWLIWGALIAVIVYVLSKKFTLLQTTLVSWLAVFVLLWIVLWNYAILPVEILPVVAPLSLVTMFVAALIARKLQGNPTLT